MPAHEKARKWFTESRFGIFIHWGLYSVHGRDVWSMFYEQTPVEEYRQLADIFQPKHYDPNEWAAIAKDAGARYMVMCTRQHDGYCLWDSATSNFTSTKTAAKRDFIGEYIQALRKAGLGVGLYYSLLDWRFPAYFKGPQKDPNGWAEHVEYVHAQVRELCTNYGKIDLLWFDGAWPWDAAAWQSERLVVMIRSLQPDILINNRTRLPEDFDTPEQHITPAPPERLWESCMTMNEGWGYNPADHEWKPTERLIRMLLHCASANGNLLLNVGPDAEGRFPYESIVRLKAVGRWLRANGESIYGSERHQVRRIGQIQSYVTVKGRTIYVHILHWPGPELVIGNLACKINSARIIDGGRPIDFRQEGSRLFLRGMPHNHPDPYDTVIALECEGAPATVNRHEV